VVCCAAMFCFSTTLVDRRQAIFGSAALIAGGGLLLIGNRLTTGDFLPTTMRAKEIAYHPSHAAAAVLGRLGDMFLRQSFLLPVSTSYLTRISPVLLVVTILAFVISFRPTKTQRERVLLGTLALLSIAVPAAYAGGGVIFDWYLYPANWLAMAVVIAVGVRLVSISRWRTVGVRSGRALDRTRRLAVGPLPRRVDPGLPLPRGHRPVSRRDQSRPGDASTGARGLHSLLFRPAHG
jgi:hypothetical protein